jgi:glycerol-3-phosphate dehydrogenase
MTHDDLGQVDVAIVGAGVVGCAIARQLSATGLTVAVLERNSDVGDSTSKANTAILHTGFDCKPGSLESQLVTHGYGLLSKYATEVGIAVERTGAILVAWDEEQRADLPSLKAKADQNGYEKTTLLSAAEVRAREPNLGDGVLGGLDVPDESIIDPWSVVVAYATEAKQNGVQFSFDAEVISINDSGALHHISTSRGQLDATWVINAAGLSSGLMNELCGCHEFSVTPRRGELLVFDKMARTMLSSIILPVPTAKTKGVLISPTVFGNVLLGPTADDIDDPNATATTEDGITRLLAAGRRVMPRLLDEEVTATYAGLRAATEHSDYQIRLHPSERYVCVGGIRSTGLTASLAIAEHVGSLLTEAGLDLGMSPSAQGGFTMPPLGQTQIRPAMNAELVAADTAYGQIVCHCELVTLGEIRDACTSLVPATDIGGLRRRTRALNGRCQGFFCGAEVTALFAQFTGQDQQFVTGLNA